jgi:mRNA interferase RelE/StbE
MYKLSSADEVLAFWDKLDAKQYRQIGRKVLSLVRNPFPQDAKALEGYAGVFRVDCGEYRIIYSINKDTIEIELIGKRNDDEVYKKFKRKFTYKHLRH